MAGLPPPACSIQWNHGGWGMGDGGWGVLNAYIHTFLEIIL